MTAPTPNHNPEPATWVNATRPIIHPPTPAVVPPQPDFPLELPKEDFERFKASERERAERLARFYAPKEPEPTPVKVTGPMSWTRAMGYHLRGLYAPESGKVILYHLGAITWYLFLGWLVLTLIPYAAILGIAWLWFKWAESRDRAQAEVQLARVQAAREQLHRAQYW